MLDNDRPIIQFALHKTKPLFLSPYHRISPICNSYRLPHVSGHPPPPHLSGMDEIESEAIRRLLFGADSQEEGGMRGTRGQIIGGYLWAVITDWSRLICKESSADYYKTAGDYGIAFPYYPTDATVQSGWVGHFVLCFHQSRAFRNNYCTKLKTNKLSQRHVQTIKYRSFCVYRGGHISYGFKKPDLSDVYPYGQ